MKRQRGGGEATGRAPCFGICKERTSVGHSRASVPVPFSSFIRLLARLSPPLASVTPPYAHSPPTSPTAPVPSLLPEPLTGPAPRSALSFRLLSVSPVLALEVGTTPSSPAPPCLWDPGHSVQSSLLSCVPRGGLSHGTWLKVSPSPGRGSQWTV